MKDETQTTPTVAPTPIDVIREALEYARSYLPQGHLVRQNVTAAIDALSEVEARYVPVLPFGMVYKSVSFGNERATITAEIGSDLAGPTINAACNAAIARIKT